jgi:hypothetical protein
MVETARESTSTEPASGRAAIDHLRRAVEDGREWPTSLLEAMALWTSPRETCRGREYCYLIAGEAFDWLLLAERLCEAVDGLVPQGEREDLLFTGRFPPTFDASSFRSLLGVEKYRGYLNYHYGVIVEEALQLATELEVHKRYASNGVRYVDDFSEEAFTRIYRAPQIELLKMFREEVGSADRSSMSVIESKEFTYWLFKRRLKVSDKPKIASDTRKGLDQLQRMREAVRASSRATQAIR